MLVVTASLMFGLTVCCCQAQQGEVAMEANLTEPGYSLELASPVPIGYVSAIFYIVYLICAYFSHLREFSLLHWLLGNCFLAWL